MFAVAVVVPPLASAKKVRNGLIAYTTGNGEEEQYEIWTIKPDGTGNRRLLHADKGSENGPSRPRWSPDGTRLLFLRGGSRDGGPPASLAYLNLANKRVRRVPLPARDFITGYDWAPDGRHLVVSLATDYPKAMLYTLRLDGTHLKKLRPGLYPSWSGDGRHIVFTLEKPRFAEPWASTVNVVRPNGTGLRRLSAPSANDDWSPSFSPGGTKVLYVSHTVPERWRMVEVTGRNDVLVRVLQTPSRFNYWCPPQWTPDGRRLAAVRTELLDPVASTVATALVTFNRSGQDARKAFTFPSEAVGTYGGGGCPFSWQRAR